MQSAESAAAAKALVASARDKPIRKLVVAIHGIGSQTRSDTIRSTARQFGRRENLPMLPLGHFHIGNVGRVDFSRLDAPDDSPWVDFGFVEVFWADIPRRLVQSADTLEETKAWARSIVSRAQSTYSNRVPQELQALKPHDFDVGVGVVEEIVEAISVLENLSFLADKAGIFKFDLGALLRDYVGDVQVVTEFTRYREEIVFRFHQGLANILARLADAGEALPEIYVVAHSEGTVVSFLGMLQALSASAVENPLFDESKAEDRFINPRRVSTNWITQVRGYMTIGSPIDKHLLLWPKLWTRLAPACPAAVGTAPLSIWNGKGTLPRQIQWRNYYDLGDPVGFRLETARGFLHEKGCSAFEFRDDRDDIGFSRYLLPGKAHVDYWNDDKVFDHFVDEVVLPRATHPPVKPKDRFLVDKISLLIPYALTYLLHLASVFALYKGVSSLLGASSAAAAATFTKVDIGILAALLMTATAAARLPRLTKTRAETWRLRWPIISALSVLAGSALCFYCLSDEAVLFIGGAFAGVNGKVVMPAFAAVLALTGWLTPRKGRWGRRLLLLTGLAMVALVVSAKLPGMPASTVIWPSLLALAGFMYLWWLAILVFDLGFVWHRYIRRSVAIETLDAWTRGRNPSPYGGITCSTRPPEVQSQTKRWSTRQAEEPS